ncbi:MAG: phosphoribosylformylglycinamidine cyclo-ligase [bacterium]|nr:phosphoribosylformylglycinamidine cyclo-ligase [bacterium]
MTESSRYAQAGVDIDAGDRVKKRIAELCRNTFTPRVLHRDGAFGGMFSLDDLKMKSPVLVSSVDGVGTKVKVASAHGQHRGIGMDLVNHCIDDLLCCGARPLMFLDYFACHKLDNNVLLQLVEGMSDACRAAGMSLIGGETAQMSDVYAPGEYDLAGTIIGAVERDGVLDGKSIQPGDVLFGLPSSGLHTNGYTLARKILLEEAGLDLSSTPDGLGRPLGDVLLEPHRSYLAEFDKASAAVTIKGVAHITGGGFEGNINRILPEGCGARVNAGAWTPPPLFMLMQTLGKVNPNEMYRVFNMGIGLILIVSEKDGDTLRSLFEEGVIAGEVIAGDRVTVEI